MQTSGGGGVNDEFGPYASTELVVRGHTGVHAAQCLPPSMTPLPPGASRCSSGRHGFALLELDA
jgi:hypothetical protein